jgi:hypothetical protein
LSFVLHPSSYECNERACPHPDPARHRLAPRRTPRAGQRRAPAAAGPLLLFWNQRPGLRARLAPVPHARLRRHHLRRLDRPDRLHGRSCPRRLPGRPRCRPPPAAAAGLRPARARHRHQRAAHPAGLWAAHVHLPRPIPGAAARHDVALARALRAGLRHPPGAHHPDGRHLAGRRALVAGPPRRAGHQPEPALRLQHRRRARRRLPGGLCPHRQRRPPRHHRRRRRRQRRRGPPGDHP